MLTPLSSPPPSLGAAAPPAPRGRPRRASAQQLAGGRVSGGCWEWWPSAQVPEAGGAGAHLANVLAQRVLPEYQNSFMMSRCLCSVYKWGLTDVGYGPPHHCHRLDQRLQRLSRGRMAASADQEGSSHCKGIPNVLERLSVPRVDCDRVNLIARPAIISHAWSRPRQLLSPRRTLHKYILDLSADRAIYVPQ